MRNLEGICPVSASTEKLYALAHSLTQPIKSLLFSATSGTKYNRKSRELSFFTPASSPNSRVSEEHPAPNGNLWGIKVANYH